MSSNPFEEIGGGGGGGSTDEEEETSSSGSSGNGSSGIGGGFGGDFGGPLGGGSVGDSTDSSNTTGDSPADDQDTVPDTPDESGETTIDTGSQTLGTDSLGTFTGDESTDERDVTVNDTQTTEQTSPAGGAGVESAAERFTGQDLSDEDEETVRETSQEASDTLTTVRRETGISPTEASSIPSAIEALGGAVDPYGDTEGSGQLSVSTPILLALGAVGLVGLVVLGGDS